MNLTSVSKIANDSRVLLRMDLDVPMDDGNVSDNYRLRKSLPTIKLLLEKKCKMVIIGHRGRPCGKDPSLSLRPVYAELMSLLERKGYDVVESVFVDEVDDREKMTAVIGINDIVFMENLRFWPGEKQNKNEFLGVLKEICKYFVNDAFGVAHRRDASIMLSKQMDTFFGLAFVEEVTELEKIRQSPERPLVIMIGGAKKDKLGYLPELRKLADKVLIGGKLISMVKEEDLRDEKTVVGMLTEVGFDINEKSIEEFEKELAKAKTVIWVGALGKFEVEEGAGSTRQIAGFLAQRDSYWIMAGGDGVASIRGLGVEDKIDLITSGGGVTLEYLTKGNLPAWKN